MVNVQPARRRGGPARPAVRLRAPRRLRRPRPGRGRGHPDRPDAGHRAGGRRRRGRRCRGGAAARRARGDEDGAGPQGAVRRHRRRPSAPRRRPGGAGRRCCSRSEEDRTPDGRTLPARVTIYEVGPARRPAEREAASCRSTTRPTSSAGCSPPACPWSRRPASCTRSGCPSWPTPAELMELLGEDRHRAARPGAQRARARPRPGAGLRAHRHLRQRHRDLRPDATSTAAWTSSSRCSSRP